MSTINKYGWTYNENWNNENWNFVCFLMRETKENDLKDVENLKKALGRISSSMGTRFGRRFSFHSMKTKLEQMRIRHRLFKKFCNTPGVTYDIENCESTVTDAYWEAVDREIDENDEFHVLMNEQVKDVQGRKLFEDDIEGGITGETSGVKVDDHNEGGTGGAAPGELVDQAAGVWLGDSWWWLSIFKFFILCRTIIFLSTLINLILRLYFECYFGNTM
ncbi:hypothetical protein ACJIZ3_006323 [Penstemon smallii]|uniref:Uncharacterized protein n=1 Tax=Penstemon smallii TaxID=265156 RepID=A0ABD3S7F9_9LAMI